MKICNSSAVAEYYDVIAISKILKTIWFIKNKALMEYLSDIIL